MGNPRTHRIVPTNHADKFMELSSGPSFFSKFVLPSGFLAALPAWCYWVLVEQKYPYEILILWSLVSLVLLWWSRTIKRVWLTDGQIEIDDYRRKITVPVSSLVRIAVNRWNQTPNILLCFDPPTEFGRKVRIIVKWDSQRMELDKIASTLNEAMKRPAQKK